MQHKKLFIVLATLLGMAVSFGAYGQKITVRGTVTDSEAKPQQREPLLPRWRKALAGAPMYGTSAETFLL